MIIVLIAEEHSSITFIIISWEKHVLVADGRNE
jgi:hypothetical protein